MPNTDMKHKHEWFKIVNNKGVERYDCECEKKKPKPTKTDNKKCECHYDVDYTSGKRSCPYCPNRLTCCAPTKKVEHLHYELDGVMRCDLPVYPNKPPKEVESWEDRFDIEASTLGLDGEQMDEMRDFVRKTLSQSRKEVEIESYKEGYDDAMHNIKLGPELSRIGLNAVRNQLRSQLRATLKRMEEKV